MSVEVRPPSRTIETSSDARRAITAYPNHSKLLSWLYLVELGMPTLRGVIVSEWSAAAAAAVSDFMRVHNVGSVLLRSDRAPETGVYPRGGYVVADSRVELEARRFLDQERIVFLLEPVSPFDDEYSMSARFDRSGVEIEVIGPGFDASDLKRGDESPHETIYVALPQRGLKAHITRVRHISHDEYRKSWWRRLVKVGRLLAERDGPIDDDSAAAIGHSELRKRGYTRLLEHEAGYIEMPVDLVQDLVVTAAPRVDELALRGGSPDQVFSASYVGDERRLVFWDVVWPQSKYPFLPAPLEDQRRPPSGGQPREIRGIAASAGIFTGRARVIAGAHELEAVRPREVLVSPVTTPEVMRVLGRIGGIVTDRGGRYSHAAVVAREAGVPAVVGTGVATAAIPNGAQVTVDGGTGVVTIYADLTQD